MEVGYAVLYEDGELVISKEHTLLQKKIYFDYGEFEDIDVPWKEYDSKKIKIVRILDSVKSNCMNGWFFCCENLITLIDFQNLDVSDCIDFAYMFYECTNLSDISTLQSWNVSSGTEFARMFESCSNLSDINVLQNWNVLNGRYFTGMFDSCYNLQNVYSLQNWNVSNGIEFSYMFYNCFNLKNIYLPNTLNNLEKFIFMKCDSDLKIHWKNKIYTYENLLEYESF